jgi:hypothetical protein
MSRSKPIFDWTLTEKSHWPPYVRPESPFGPTDLEIMRSCALRLCFNASAGYERRTDYSARVGTAFHRTLQSLAEHPINATSLEQIGPEAIRRFRVEMAEQERRKSERIREQTLQPTEERVQRAMQSVVTEAQRIARNAGQQRQIIRYKHHTDENEEHPAPVLNPLKRDDTIWAEVAVQSQDGLLSGRVDYAERLPGDGIRLLDYKSALRNDVPERYERQLQIYALLWYETFGEWPVEAFLYYPLTGTMHQIHIQPPICQQQGDEARKLIKNLLESSSVASLATPGNVCTVCDCRPWCQPFWKWQASRKQPTEALTDAAYGFEGLITRLELKEQYWRVTVKWRDAEVSLVAPQERFPQLHQASIGTHIRVLDMRLQGLRARPRAMINERSEIFIVKQ